MKSKELVGYKCVRCNDVIVSESDSRFLDMAGHLFDRHRDDPTGKDYEKRFPKGSFLVEDV